VRFVRVHMHVRACVRVCVCACARMWEQQEEGVQEGRLTALSGGPWGGTV